MRTVATIAGAIAVLIGLGLMYMAYEATTILSGAVEPSAVQITQVYSEASFYGIMAIACFSFAAVMTLAQISQYTFAQMFFTKNKG